jgi:hypothetical protein
MESSAGAFALSRAAELPAKAMTNLLKADPQWLLKTSAGLPLLIGRFSGCLAPVEDESTLPSDS